MILFSKAKNGISSLSFHTQRRKYVRNVYPFLNSENAIDTWYGPKALYGRINHVGDTQMISETNIKSFPSAPDLFAVDFVVDAFRDFRSEIIRGAQKGKINVVDSFIGKFQPRRAWVSARREYDKNIREIYVAFVRYYLARENRQNKIEQFEDFMEQFLNYLAISAQRVPITLSGFITSQFISPLTSGLMVEIASFDYDSDALKFNKFLSDPNFLFYQNTAKKYGFRIDYNIPWRLVADISSASMRKYMDRYGIKSVKDLFNTYYYDAYKLDLATIKPYLIQLYNDYVSGNPFVKKIAPGTFHKPFVKTSIIHRQMVSERDLDARLDNFYWLKFYFYVRSSELNIRWPEEVAEKKLQQTKNILKRLDFPAALGYISDELFKSARG